MEKPIPQAIHEGTIIVGPLTLHVFILDDGERIIDADDLHSLLDLFGSGYMPTPQELKALNNFGQGTN